MNKQIEELILQSYQHELGGVEVYSTALKCVLNEDLKEEWSKYLAETKTHVEALEGVCESLGIDKDKETPGCAVVKHLGQSLVTAMEMALAADNPEAAELVACECVVIAETKDHQNWSLLGKCIPEIGEDQAAVLQAAYDEIEDQEDEHLYHSKGWCRELWIKSLGLEAILPPLEEQKDVKTAIGAARAEQASNAARLQ